MFINKNSWIADIKTENIECCCVCYMEGTKAFVKCDCTVINYCGDCILKVKKCPTCRKDI